MNVGWEFHRWDITANFKAVLSNEHLPNGLCVARKLNFIHAWVLASKSSCCSSDANATNCSPSTIRTSTINSTASLLCLRIISCLQLRCRNGYSFHSSIFDESLIKSIIDSYLFKCCSEQLKPSPFFGGRVSDRHMSPCRYASKVSRRCKFLC